MPTRPLRPCPIPGCSSLTTKGPCAQHKGQDSTSRARTEADKNKGWTREFYTSPEWRELRARVLIEEPICKCGAPTTIGAHRKSIRLHPELRLERSNVRGSCKHCHDQESAARDGGFGNRRVSE
jgi:5-methylcytosine-specific restriction protein A